MAMTKDIKCSRATIYHYHLHYMYLPELHVLFTDLSGLPPPLGLLAGELTLPIL